MLTPRQLTLNLFIHPSGHHEAVWRHEKSQPGRVLDIAFHQELAQRAKAAKFDAVFFADGASLPENVRYSSRVRFEPLIGAEYFMTVGPGIGGLIIAGRERFEVDLVLLGMILLGGVGFAINRLASLAERRLLRRSVEVPG